MSKITKATEFLKKHIGCYSSDEYRQGYHIMPIIGWMNDPHAPVFFQGQYHLFF